MDIKILDSWLREYLKTKATAKQIAEYLSLTSVSIERVDSIDNDFLYHIEVTTNRPDLMSVTGLAQEASAVLPEFGIAAQYQKPTIKQLKTATESPLITIKNDPKLVNRICAAVLEVKVKPAPEYIQKRLEASDIRSLNNLIDVTNYIMREMGHPTHVFDLDRLGSTMIIRESKKGEKIETLDHKVHTLAEGDIVADNGKGEIVDLLGIMGTANSVVTNETKKVLLFLDNNEPLHMRRTSMSLGIRSEAVVLNEKGIDPELALPTLQRGIELLEEIADAKLIGDIIDIYPNKPKTKKVVVSKSKLNTVVGVTIEDAKAQIILEKLGFSVKDTKDSFEVTIPTNRLRDMDIAEDVIEEVARVYGYHKLPTLIPPIENIHPYNIHNEFYIERKIKEALKYWGFIECYTYSMVSENLYEGPITSAIKLANPLSEDHVYMRKTLVPSLLEVIANNKTYDNLKIFELSYVYSKKQNALPEQTLMLAAVIKKEHASFFETKGIIEQLMLELGIKNYIFKEKTNGGEGASIFINDEFLGDIEILETNIINFELSFEILYKNSTLQKTYTPIAKFPPVIEDIRIEVETTVTFEKIQTLIKKQSPLIKSVSLLDVYENKKTFRITYQDFEKNLTSDDIAPIREKIIHVLQSQLKAKVA